MLGIQGRDIFIFLIQTGRKTGGEVTNNEKAPHKIDLFSPVPISSFRGRKVRLNIGYNVNICCITERHATLR